MYNIRNDLRIEQYSQEMLSAHQNNVEFTIESPIQQCYSKLQNYKVNVLMLKLRYIILNFNNKKLLI